MGHFSLRAHSEGRYRVTAEFQQEDVVHTASQGVELGGDGARVRLRFEPGRELSGVVVDARGQPVEGAQVEVRSALRTPSRNRKGPGRGQRMGPDGRFTFQSVSGDPLELTVEKPERVLACAEQEDGRIALPVKPGDRELRVVLLRYAFVSGRFLRDDGTPIPAFAVKTREGRQQARGWFDKEGHFSVPILCTGTIQLELIASDEVDVRGGSRRLRRSVSVREEVDLDVGALMLDGG
ncbi:carboxypeptidase-like regulatory domain-containing protein [Archangium sp.]|uniref:carboxypeptidase-like regulatory domain-containing protein n=1 Tax=Archangium sp. TaxID=1872627 RepID=UPI002D25C4B2|nr:carboxypeptidase-like regulatory domain-containing protein [Archangium sp.]HYO55014.1 carboxypeptidase-like regulatory domain-containing protein [Archangium sp.]